MFVLLGLKTVLHGHPERMATCQYCHQFAQHQLQERATKFTVFFIPVFTTSRAYAITCTNCGQNSIVKPRQKNTLLR